MKFPILCLAALVAVSRFAFAAEPAAPTPSAADKDWDAAQYMTLIHLKSVWQPFLDLGINNTEQMKPSQRARLDDSTNKEVATHSANFIAAHPDDPRRWQAMLNFMIYQPKFITGFLPGYDQAPSSDKLVIDVGAKAAWAKQKASFDSAMVAAGDAVPPSVREGRTELDINPLLSQMEHGTFTGDTNDVSKKLADLAARYPDLDGPSREVNRFLNDLQDDSTTAMISALAAFAGSTNQDVVKIVDGKKRLFVDGTQKPFDLKFTALDGREVDLSKLRGKVVLLDFWSTGCPPCVKETPGMVATYRKYHDQGFEIIGISLEGSDDKEHLAKFLDKNGVTWPQYFDGKGWQNEFFKKYSIQVLPTPVLLDKNGLMVSTDARGEKLDAEVKKLLGM